MMTARFPVAIFAAFLVALATIAWLSPEPNRVTDRAVYEATAARMIVVDCSDLQCFRVLVPWVLGRLPGPSIWRFSTGTSAPATTACNFCKISPLSIPTSSRS